MLATSGDRNSAEASQIANSYGSNGSLVVVDEEYLAETGKYWTSYKVDSSGEYVLYYMYPNGVTSDIKKEEYLSSSENTKGYTSLEEAEEDGVAFVKKAETVSTSKLNANSSERVSKNVIWSAYDFGLGGDTGWTYIDWEDGNNYVEKVYNDVGLADPDDEEAKDSPQIVNSSGGFYFNITSTTSITQVEDAQRSQTNSTVKWLFKYRKYYIYDGSTDTALAIAEDKEAAILAIAKYFDGKYNADKVVGWLGNYGRSALRKTYGYTLTFSTWLDDSNTVTENAYEIVNEWLDWQLDMYYSGIYDCSGYDGPYIKDLTWTVEVDLDGDGEKESYTREADPRNPDLIGTVNITKNSLNAFSILENTKTLAAEYAYRDFKELIVELDYFDKEDLSDAISSIFTWVIPDVAATGWPNRPWDKQDNDYGALIESSSTYGYLEQVDYDPTTMSVTATSGMAATQETATQETATQETATQETATQETATQETATQETESSSSIDLSKLWFIGDSWIDGLKDSKLAETTYFYSKEGKSAASNELSMDSITSDGHKDASAIVLYLGVNNPDSYNDMIELVNSLKSYYEVPIYVIKVNHVGEGYTNASTMNSRIDTYNSKVKEGISDLEDVYFIDTSDGLEDENGYLINCETSEYLHLKSYDTWYNNIISAINSTGSSSGSSLATFVGYSGGEAVVSPVTGRVLEYGTHERTNVYTGDTEIVGYITIEAMSSENQMDGLDVSNNSADVENTETIKIDDEEFSGDGAIIGGYNKFAKEYDDTCQGFIITIDGINVDLNLQVDSANGVYEQNEIAKLYNSDAMESREKEEELKYNAPFFINVGGSETIGSLPAVEEVDYSEARVVYTYSGSCTYYIKEGKYIGTTMTDDEAVSRVTEEGTTALQSLTYGTEEGDVTATDFVYEGPANYIRIILKDVAYSIIDDVEDYFDIPEADETSSSGSAYNAFNADVTEDELEMLAAVLLAENGASTDSMAAVCQVIKNRGNDTVHFSSVSTIADVLTSSGQYGTVFPVGDNNDSSHMGGYGTAPSGSYTKIYDLGEYGKFVVGNQSSSSGFNERLATTESRAVAEGVLSGSIDDVPSAKMGKLALYQVTASEYRGSADGCCYEFGELFAHSWGCLVGSHESCDCTLP